ncbi:hypothetical protein AK812_SmicGene31745 [Symbiodinium microadriaticum]|uniref:Uncharacterized protein n=1 Tax=Symbiodinium microadriaticum TaxID=2951 RepID=A0A1Q9CVX1_SYMMI|nr:hypothetical protein AK812_SmicGene31745 [Symbiodinium microadriaticum]
MPIARPKTCAKTNDDDDDDDDKVAKRTKHVMRKQIMILRGIEMLSSPVLQQMKLLDAVMVAIGACATLLQLVSISGRRALVVKGDRHSRAVQSRGIDTEESASCQGAKKGRATVGGRFAQQRQPPGGFRGKRQRLNAAEKWQIEHQRQSEPFVKGTPGVRA